MSFFARGWTVIGNAKYFLDGYLSKDNRKEVYVLHSQAPAKAKRPKDATAI